MKLLWTFCVLKMICSAAPIVEHPDLPEDEFRDKRSSFNIPYVSPCAASPPMVPSYMNLPVQHHLRPQYYYPRYRSIDPSEMHLLNMNAIRSAQSIPTGMEAIPAPNKPDITSYPPPMSQMPAVGIFPYVNPDLMNVPLLITCTPSIAQGQMMQPHVQHNSYRSGGIRDTEYEDIFERDNENKPDYFTNPQKQEEVAVKPQ